MNNEHSFSLMNNNIQEAATQYALDLLTNFVANTFKKSHIP